jgi:hypothetical protein
MPRSLREWKVVLPALGAGGRTLVFVLVDALLRGKNGAEKVSIEITDRTPQPNVEEIRKCCIADVIIIWGVSAH